jgi:hypothetical protein
MLQNSHHARRGYNEGVRVLKKNVVAAAVQPKRDSAFLVATGVIVDDAQAIPSGNRCSGTIDSQTCSNARSRVGKKVYLSQHLLFGSPGELGVLVHRAEEAVVPWAVPGYPDQQAERLAGRANRSQITLALVSSRSHDSFIAPLFVSGDQNI